MSKRVLIKVDWRKSLSVPAEVLPYLHAFELVEHHQPDYKIPEVLRRTPERLDFGLVDEAHIQDAPPPEPAAPVVPPAPVIEPLTIVKPAAKQIIEKASDITTDLVHETFGRDEPTAEAA